MPSLNELPEDELLTGAQASQYLHLTKNTLKIYRHRKTGPTYIRIGGSIFYRVDHLKQYLQQGEIITPTAKV